MISSDSFAITSNVTVCCIGASHVGVPVSTVIAHNCPNINVSITDLNPNRIIPWNEKLLRIHEPELEKMLEKCLEDNLIFTTDMRSAIVLADIVLIAVEVPTVQSDDQIIVNTNELEEAARIVAKMSESNKIIVQKCTAPLETLESFKRILNANKSKSVNFQVLTMPEFFSSGTAMSDLSSPEFVLIGRQKCVEDDEAAATLAAIYSNWVPWERIKIMSDRSVELVRMGINVLLAQEVVSMGALGVACERSGKNLSAVVIKGKRQVPIFSLGEANLDWDVLNLINLCEKRKTTATVGYWQEILEQDNHRKERLKNKILSAFSNCLDDKKLAVFGLSFKITGEITRDSPAVSLITELLREGATLSLCDPNLEVFKENVVKALKEYSTGSREDRVAMFEDPYKAAAKVDGIIFCNDFNDLKSLDYAVVYESMTKPAYIFDGRNILDHDHLARVGFSVVQLRV